MSVYVPSRFVRVIDDLIGVIAPKSALERHIARQRLHLFRYEAASSSRERRTSSASLGSPESSGYQRDRVQLGKDGRDLAENGDLAAGILGKFENHVIGSLRYQARTGDDTYDGEIEEYFGDWSRICDLTGRHSFHQLAQLGLREVLAIGDEGTVVVRDGGRLLLAGIEADRIGNPHESRAEENYVGGILLDELKRPKAYRVYNRTVTGAYENPVEIPAHSFIHVFKPRRYDEYRGISAFHPVINTVRDIKEIVEFEKLAVKWASCQTGVVSSDAKGPDVADYYESGTYPNSGTAQRIEEITPGRVNYIPENGRFEQFKIDRPGAAWQGFLQLLIRLYAAGLNLDYGFVFDMSGLTGPAARFVSEQAKRTFQGWQRLLEDKKLNRIKNLVIANGIANGDLKAKPNWMRGVWQFPAHPTIDIGRESAANLNENRQGIKSMDTILGPEGLDGGEEREKIAQEAADWLRLSKKHNVPVEMMRLLTPNGNELQTDKQGGATRETATETG